MAITFFSKPESLGPGQKYQEFHVFEPKTANSTHDKSHTEYLPSKPLIPKFRSNLPLGINVFLNNDDFLSVIKNQNYHIHKY